jgi:hypothetical protein
MTPKQKRIVAALAIADLVIISGLAALMMHLARVTTLSLPAPGLIAATTPGSLPHPADETCQWQAAQQMVQAGLSGSVTLNPGGTLHFQIAALAPDQTTDDAAQLVWTAFDVALALGGDCAFTQVEVTIRIQDSATTLHASVAAADLAAYGAGTLTGDEFIDRVTYTVGGW